MYPLRSSFYHFLLPLLVVAAFQLHAAAQAHADQVETLITRYHEQGLFNGAALVAENGEVIFKGGFGDANMAWDIRNTLDTRFRIASSTKQFTAALILTLVEDGLLALDDAIIDHLPDYPEQPGSRVTIHHLLTHTSGIPSYTSLPGFMSDEVRDPFEPDSMVALFSDLDLQFDPGTQWAYSNSGYILLGVIAEAVTDTTYEAALHERVLDPLGLENTGYDHYEEIIARSATGYVRTDDGYQRAPYLDTSVPYAAGMLYSTVEDLFKWDQSLYDNGPFEETETKEVYLSSHVSVSDDIPEEAGLPPHYGYGWFVGDVPIAGDTVRVIEHGGNIFGFTAGFWRMPEERNTVILLDNTFNSRIREVGRAVRSILYGGDPEVPGGKG